jgi:hypothetical protein
MDNLFLHLGNEHYVNLDTVKYIVEANAEKVRKYRMDRGIEKNSDAFLNGSSDKETRSLIIHKDGTICTSSVTAKSLRDRANMLVAETKKG